MGRPRAVVAGGRPECDPARVNGVEARIRVHYQPGAPGDLGMRRITVVARDTGGHPVGGVAVTYTIAEGPGFLGDGDEEIVGVRANAQGVATVYWYPVADRSFGPGEMREAVVHARCDDPTVARLEAARPS